MSSFRRPVLVAVVLVGAGLLLLPLIFQRDEPETRTDNPNEIYDDLYDYLRLVTEARRDEDGCEDADPAAGAQECADFVSVLAGAQASLNRAETNLRGLIAAPPPDAPQNALDAFDFLLAAVEAVAEADKALINAWHDGDKDAWTQSWIERESLAEAFASSTPRP